MRLDKHWLGGLTSYDSDLGCYTLYYTFSTVAQSIAAAIAFLGAFVLFKLQASEARLGDTLSTLADQTTIQLANVRMMMLIRSRQYEKALESIKINPASLGQEFESAHTDAVRSIRAIHHTRKAFRYILYAAICLIVVSFIGLALVDRIKYSTLLNTIFWLYILYSICVLLSMAKLMQNMIFEDRS